MCKEVRSEGYRLLRKPVVKIFIAMVLYGWQILSMAEALEIDRDIVVTRTTPRRSTSLPPWAGISMPELLKAQDMSPEGDTVDGDESDE